MGKIMKKDALKNYFENNKERILKEWFELLSFPSVSVNPAHAKDCEECAKWLVKHLSDMSFDARLIQTNANPIVFAEKKHPTNPKTVLIYGHYDVQPADPLDHWITPPFQPTLRDGAVYARGAEDNKGQLFCVLKAVEALVKNDSLPCSIKIIIEGEEEYGSTQITKLLQTKQEYLKADVLMVPDVGMAGNQPAVVMGLRGLVGLAVTLQGPLHDIHSGKHGGVAPNPATAMARLLAKLHNEDGSIAVKDFLKGVRKPTAEEAKMAKAIPFDAQTYEAEVGVPPIGGQKGISPVERLAFHPTIEVNGLHSGYGGAGSKTIIPSTAIAKITARLVADQNPDEALHALKNFFLTNKPEGMKMELSDETIPAPTMRIAFGTPEIELARKVLKDVTGQDALYLYEGASIPIIPELANAAGARPLLVGFGQEENRIHSPNEMFRIDQFKMGFLYSALFITAFGS